MVRLTLLFLLHTYYAAVTDASVGVEHRKYSCCGGLQLQADIDPRCDQMWAMGDEPIASYKKVSEACQSPCKAVSSGNITLNECVNATVTIVCTKEPGGVQVQERRIFFYGEVCTDAPNKTDTGNQRGHYGPLIVFLLLLVVVMMVGIALRVRTAGLQG